MHLPSERIYKEMRSEEVGTWIVPANGGKETALLIKAPTNALKAIVSGAKMSMVYAFQESYLCSAIRVYDVPEEPLLLCNIQRHEEEHCALRKVASVGKTPIFLFNELDVCVAWSDGILSEGDRIGLNEFLSKHPIPYSGEYSAEAIKALDNFCSITNQMTEVLASDVMAIIETPIQYGKWVSNMVSFAGNNDLQTIVLDDRDEGGVLEKSIWASLESVFPFGLHKSPQVKIGKKQRELIDVVAFYQYGSFFIEAKDLSVFAAGLDRTRERRVLGVQKQAEKAIGQLVGASKTAKRGVEAFNAKGSQIPLVLDKPLHCIVLLTELIHEGDWTEVEDAIRSAAMETGDYFHVFDLRELVMLLKCSSGQAHRLDYNLMKRFERFVEAGTIHIRSRPAPK
ncbi:hypothetical protein GTP44_07290 [Duganella sp. FT50W]|uniref:Uncharacterized protein n=1 Tax=Duganella lactea TaxID=2692173 RepID=A0A6L8MIM2_9BURK|nr:hypothetical protein [Duganella lactea]MYM81762.1 hypothetical protein [Duganella lactea]